MNTETFPRGWNAQPRARLLGYLVIGLAAHLGGCAKVISAGDLSRVDCVANCDAPDELPDGGTGAGGTGAGGTGAGGTGAGETGAGGTDAGGTENGAFDGSASSDRATVNAALGEPCLGDTECGSGICAQGVCCPSRCNTGCVSCALSGREGTCSSVPAGEDPLDDCADMGAPSCSYDGTCDGAGHCRLYEQGRVCAAAECKDGMATAARNCDGQGTCGAGAATACAPHQCAGTACDTTCSGVNGCASGFACSSGQCMNLATGLVGYWKLDESSDGSMAADSSGHGFNLANVGSTTTTAAPNHPATFPNPYARNFQNRNRDALQIADPSAVLRPTSLTISAWSKATTTDTGGSMIVSSNDDYALYLLRGGDSKFATRFGGGNWESCIHTASNALDGHWHHLAATFASPSRMEIWFDGIKVTCPSSHNIVYSGTAFAIGRDPIATGGDFDGTLDDVRIYNRVLSDVEILALFAGQ